MYRPKIGFQQKFLALLGLVNYGWAFVQKNEEELNKLFSIQIHLASCPMFN